MENWRPVVSIHPTEGKQQALLAPPKFKQKFFTPQACRYITPGQRGLIVSIFSLSTGLHPSSSQDTPHSPHVFHRGGFFGYCSTWLNPIQCESSLRTVGGIGSHFHGGPAALIRCTGPYFGLSLDVGIGGHDRSACIHIVTVRNLAAGLRDQDGDLTIPALGSSRPAWPSSGTLCGSPDHGKGKGITATLRRLTCVVWHCCMRQMSHDVVILPKVRRSAHFSGDSPLLQIR